MVYFHINQGPGFKKTYQINLKSNSGPINVLLVNKDADNQSPVVVQVPPADEDLAAQAIAAAQADQNTNPNTNTRPPAKVSKQKFFCMECKRSGKLNFSTLAI